MKSRLNPNARTSQIVAAIREGVATSHELAARFGSTVKAIGSDLNRLAAAGHIVRAGVEPTETTGRPRLRWRAMG